MPSGAESSRAMQSNLLTHVMATTQISTTISQELVLLRKGPLRHSDQSSPGGANSIEARTKRRRNTSRSGITQSTMTRTPLGTIIIRRQLNTVSFDEDGELSTNPHSQDETTWIFMPSFFSHCIDFRYARTWSGVQAALRTYPVIRDTHPALDMCTSGDVEGLQKLFSEQQLSPFSIDTWGFTLLDVSMQGIAENRREQLTIFQVVGRIF